MFMGLQGQASREVKKFSVLQQEKQVHKGK